MRVMIMLRDAIIQTVTMRAVKRKKKGLWGKSARILLAGCLAACLAVCSAGCGRARPKQSGMETDATDQMYSKEQKDVQIDVFRMNGQVYTVENVYPVDCYLGEEEKDGGFYRILADVTFLNGGVAGYYNFPQIRQVKEWTEVSPFDIGLPVITEKQYGVVLIGDYADGDIFLRESGKKAVWKDGDWIWQYSRETVTADGKRVCLREGVTEEEAGQGIADGVLSCGDYFVIPGD
ncbi:MAG: hypothetical protein Q4D81_14515 [Eubacteriales bacterium]|nr:hypothetical protein [Eubacteriales bacterium]